MNKQQYKDQLNQIILDCEDAKAKLEEKYALANNDVEIGNIVIGRFQTIRVENISIYVAYGEDFPGCKYYGESLTKKLKPRKDPAKGAVHQCNLKSIIKKGDDSFTDK